MQHDSTFTSSSQRPAERAKPGGNSTTEQQRPQPSECNISYMQQEQAATAATAVEPTPTATDVIGEILGDFGVWQLRTVLIISLCKVPAAWFMACSIFTAPELYPNTEYICDPQEYAEANASVTADQCYIVEYMDAEHFTLRECRKFLYDFGFHSIVMEFDLICMCDIFIAWSQYWHLFGILVGSITATKLMQFVSPRSLYIAGMLAQITCGSLTGYVRDFSLHCACRCLVAVCCWLMVIPGQAIIADITAGKHRMAAIMLYDICWSIALILLPSIAALAPSWRHIYLCISLPTLLLLLLLRWTPESPRWLLAHLHNDERTLNRVEEIACEAAALNDRGFMLPYNLRAQLYALRQSLQCKPATAAWQTLWQGKRATVHMLAAHMAHATFLVSFIGLLLNIRAFGRDNLARNAVILALSEILGCFLAVFVTFKQQHWKWQWAGGFSIIAGLIGCLSWLRADSKSQAEFGSMPWILFAVLPKIAASCVLAMLNACVDEFVPVHKREIFAFSVVTWARVWLLSASFLIALKQINIALSLSAYCVLVTVGGICSCFLLTPRELNELADIQTDIVGNNHTNTTRL